MPNLTIAHVLAPAAAGGLESVVRALATGHRARGHRVVIAASVDTPDHPFVRTLSGDGVEVVPFHVRSRDVRGERQIVAQLIHAIRPHVLHTHGYRPDIVDLPVARRYRVPNLTTLHGFTGGGWKLRLYERLQLRAIRGANAVVAVSRGVAARAQQIGVRQHRLHMIPNAYAATTTPLARTDARHELGIADDMAHVAWIGRMSQEKGPDIMVEALPLLRDLPLVISFIGDGPDRRALEARARTLGVADRVRWHGLVPDAARLLPAFDAVALSSRTEGTPMVVLEAMAAHVPVIATNVGGIPDMLSSDDAWLIAPESPSLLASAIRDAITNPRTACARAQRARHRLATDFDVTAWLDRYEALYTSIQP